MKRKNILKRFLIFLINLYQSITEPKVSIEEWKSIDVVNSIDLDQNIIRINSGTYKIQKITKMFTDKYITIYLNCLRNSDFITIKLVKDRESGVKTLHIDKYQTEEIYF